MQLKMNIVCALTKVLDTVKMTIEVNITNSVVLTNWVNVHIEGGHQVLGMESNSGLHLNMNKE